MFINEKTALSSSRVLLVPYCKHHVPRYHEWMKDLEIQQATASEPLALEEEYAMQASWRTDADKLTFIICLPVHETFSLSPSALPARIATDINVSPPAESSGTTRALADPCLDAPESMLGDVNLFLRLDEEGEEEGGNDHGIVSAANRGGARVVGEIELMIAEKAKQGKGFGKAGLVCFLKYIADHERDILRGFVSSLPSSSAPVSGGVSCGHTADDARRDEAQVGKVVGEKLAYLSAKIGADNVRSLALFESLGFRKVSDKPNVFGEVELRREGFRGIEGGELLRRCGVEECTEMRYER
ncbi:hypothetical protein BDBG_01864 [Blastomyces gilchristii SLH14081]|uniref:N-acetyltransferase domain-containing protein n=1 Tax=Blastomyces gilchristii (strain SLH14081) TaxID=559298 RepID=A0A179UC06_BLAGS|nr:uncharacterized protein BDBG_01864 [Blastomyces gilchristii SLH14081]OAT05474.1 hypothetical protein BDBG_01864 [Blastomyces gilchristii SLH14081]